MDAQLGILWGSDKTKAELGDLRKRMNSLDSRVSSTEDECRKNIRDLAFVGREQSAFDRDAERMKNKIHVIEQWEWKLEVRFQHMEKLVSDMENAMQEKGRTIEELRIQLHQHGIDVRPMGPNPGSDGETFPRIFDSYSDSLQSGGDEGDQFVMEIHGVDRIANEIREELEHRGWSIDYRWINTRSDPVVIVMHLSQVINDVLERYELNVKIHNDCFDCESTATLSRFVKYYGAQDEHNEVYNLSSWENQCPPNEGIVECLARWLWKECSEHDPSVHGFQVGLVESVVSSSNSDSPRFSAIPLIDNMKNVLDYVERILTWGHWRFEKKSDEHAGNDHIVIYTIHNTEKFHGNYQEYLLDIMISHSDSEINVIATIRQKSSPTNFVASWSSLDIALDTASVSSWRDHNIKRPISEESIDPFKVEKSFESWIRVFIDEH